MNNENTTKYVLFSFPGNVSVKEYAPYIFEAIDHAELNLKVRHGVIIDNCEVNDNSFVIKVIIPTDISKKYQICNMFRGVSAYLLKHYNEIFSPLRSGKRLFYIKEIRKDDSKLPLQNIDPVYYISKFVSLFNHEFTMRSKEKLDRIISILNE